MSDQAKPPGRRARKLKSTKDNQRAAQDMGAAPSEDEQAQEFEGGEEDINERSQSMDFEKEESKKSLEASGQR